MIDYVAENNRILDEWKESNESKGEVNFAPDGIMYRDSFDLYENGCERLESSNNVENKEWNEAPVRILFFTKDQNAGGADAWDVRCEIVNLKYAFYRNLIYQLYGLVYTKPDYKPEYIFTDEEAIDLYNTFPIARINVKKEAGTSSVSNKILRYYLERDQNFIKRQVDNLEADIIVCCGYSESTEGSGNLLLNFLNDKCDYHFEQQHKDGWMWYDKQKNKLAINNFHLAVRTSSEKIYNEMIMAYYTFLQEHPHFIDSHRL